MAKVLIVGAGLAGLTLAHKLHGHGVPYEVFERDTAKDSRSQGWAVALVESLDHLEKLLPKDAAEKLPTKSVNYETGETDEIGFVHGQTGETVGIFGGAAPGQKGYFLRTSRQDFRNFLLESRELNVSWGKHCIRYTEEADSVTAHFKDGSSATGTLLIGADGVHSHILDQLVGEDHHKPTFSQYVAIFGQVNLPAELYEPLRARGRSVILCGAPGVRLQIGTLHMNKDKSPAPYFWSFMLSREDPEALSNWMDHASRQEIYDFAVKSAEVLHPVLKDPIRYGGPDAIAMPQPKFLEFEPSFELPRGRVSVIGDAAHAMIPFRGAGANTAMLDASDLGQLLVEAWQQEQDLAKVLDRYLEVMVPRGIENVVASRKAGEGKGDPAEEWAAMFQRPDNSA